MIDYPEIDPVLITLGPLQIRWYGLMYLLGFAASYLLVTHQVKQVKWKRLAESMDNLNLSLIVGVILGGRLGYVLFYNPSYYLEHPAAILATWEGGMSFHGGCLGALIAGFLYCRKTGLNFFKAADLYVVTVPVGLFLGRIGNFINGELFGRHTDVPWAMVFPQGGSVLRHPSQLYEAFLEGLVLFVILWSLHKKPWQKASPLWPHGSMLALFLILYGLFRSFVEFFREPDAQIGFLLLNLTMGQWLSAAMILLGGALWIWKGKAVSRT